MLKYILPVMLGISLISPAYAEVDSLKEALKEMKPVAHKLLEAMDKVTDSEIEKLGSEDITIDGESVSAVELLMVVGMGAEVADTANAEIVKALENTKKVSK